jgi:hypothetical protein
MYFLICRYNAIENLKNREDRGLTRFSWQHVKI